MSSVVISGDTSGAITLSAPAVAGTNTATLPAATGTVMVSGNMPAFVVYLNGNQNVTSGVFTKIAFNTKLYDTANAFDATTNYRFQPNVAGYYQLCLTMSSETSVNPTRIALSFYKNGTEYSRCILSPTANSGMAICNSQIIYLNGSTDYVEGWGIVNASSASFNGLTAPYATIFSGSLVRTA